jgi:predicted enzyme related to lactoylglutathione lyase
VASTVIRWQLVSPQPETVASFYHGLFGWSVTQDNQLGYREVKSGDGRGIDGGIWPAPPGQAGFVQLFVEVSDLDECLEKAVRLGARVILPKSALPDGDSMAILLDPTGISLGVCTLARRKG